MAESSGGSCGDGSAHRAAVLEPKHKIFLSHSGAQKAFVEWLCEELERCLRYPFFDLREESLPIGENFVKHIFGAIKECYVGIVILSEEFFTSKWPMTELAAMVDEVEKRNDFKLIPVFLHTSLADFDNPENQKRWQECWDVLAKTNPGRVEVGKWEAALKYIRPLNGLEKKPGLRELEFVKQIVDRICAILPAEMRLDYSYIQGGSRLCKVIQDKIDLQRMRTSGGVCKVGLYGMGGMGKTTICKALCNDFFTKFRGRVCHAELERVNEEELLRDVLKMLSNTRQEVINRFNLDKLRNGLKEGAFMTEAVFLALDNMSDSHASIREAKGYLTAKLPVGSIVIVTTRYKEALAQLGLSMDDDCMKMPELELEEARSLFVKSCEGRNEDNEQLIERCVERCHFRNDEKQGSYHYHPLALDVLGRELAWLDDPKEWKEQLDRIDKDIFNLSNERDHHPIFSILRKSFDALPEEDQLLFIDVILFLIHRGLGSVVYDKIKVLDLEWLGMVHDIARADVMEKLTRLKRKSLLESIDDGSERSIRVHDLWRAFAVAETKRGDLRGRRWVYETKTCNGSSLCETSPSGNCWGNVKRMAFLGCGSRSLGRVNFADFPNVTVLTIEDYRWEEKQVVDLSGLVRLRSLVIVDARDVIVQGLPGSLIFLMLRRCIDSGFENSIAKQIGGLKKLQWLELIRYAGGKLPDMRNMISLHEAIFNGCSDLITLTGLSLALRVLEFIDCRELRSCPGVGDVVALEELRFRRCEKLESFPNVGRLRMLRKLDIGECNLITELPGVGDLVALEELSFWECEKLESLPNLGRLRMLRKLNIGYCRLITELPGVGDLVALEELSCKVCEKLESLPNLGRLRMLRKLNIGYGTLITELPGVGDLVALEELSCGSGCEKLESLPNLGRLRMLRKLNIGYCTLITELPGVGDLVALEELSCEGCEKLESLPNLGRLRMLRKLNIGYCTLITELPGVGDLVALEELSCGSGCEKLESLPNLGRLRMLRKLNIGYCTWITELPGVGDLVALEELRAPWCRKLSKLPDMRKLINLRVLDLSGCSSISEVSGFDSLVSLEKVEADFRAGVDKPNLRQLTKLQSVQIGGWSAAGIQGLDKLTMLHTLRIGDCSGVDELPDLQSLTRLQSVNIVRSDFKDLSGLSNLIALKFFWISDCKMLETLPAGQGLTSLRLLEIRNCAGLRRWDCTTVEQVEGRSSRSEDTSVVDVDVSDSHTESELEGLVLTDCGVSDLSSIGGFSQLGV